MRRDHRPTARILSGVVGIALLLAAASLVSPALGRADTALLPADLGLPWTDPAHQSPLEQLLTPLASKIAGRPVTVRCEGDNDWGILATQEKFDPTAEAGYVESPSFYLASNRFVSSASGMELSPGTCLYLQQFAQATVKPTKCQATTSETMTVTRQRLVTRYRVVTLKKPTRIDGRLLEPGVWRIPFQVRVPYTATTTHDVLAPPAPCFVGTPATSGGWCWAVPDQTGTPQTACYAVNAKPPAPYWSLYYRYAAAIGTLAHESIHLWQIQAGALVPSDALVEAQATCSALQWLSSVAAWLGATPDDARAIATFYWTITYPSYLSLTDAYAKSHPYWSADCTPGGPLDIRSDPTGPWP